MGILIYLSIVYYVAMISLVTDAGSKKEIGGLNTFLISLLFSPILGMLFVINSKEITDWLTKPNDADKTLVIIAVGGLVLLYVYLFM